MEEVCEFSDVNAHATNGEELRIYDAWSFSTQDSWLIHDIIDKGLLPLHANDKKFSIFCHRSSEFPIKTNITE
jgi:hypothetical protein